MIGNGVQQAFAMLASIGIARVLGKVGFGEYGAIRSTTVVFGILAGAGLGLTATHYVAHLRSTDPVRAGRVIRMLMTVAWITTLLAAALCAGLARPISGQVMHSAHLAVPLAISALALVLSTVGGVQAGILAGCEDFRALATILIIEGFGSAVLTVGGAVTGGVTGAILGFVAGTAVGFVLRARAVRLACRRAGIPIPSMRAFDAGELSILRSFVLPATLVSVAAQPAEWAARMLLVGTPDGMAQLGIFSAAYTWAYVVQFVPNQVAGTAMPILSNVLATGDRRTFRRMLASTTGLVFAVAAAIAIPLALLSRWIMSFYGPAFRAGSEVLVIIVLAYALGAVSSVLRFSGLSAGRAWLQFVVTGLWAVTLPVAFIALGSSGAKGLALSYGVAFIVGGVLQLLAAWYMVGGAARPAGGTPPPVSVPEDAGLAGSDPLP
jgi:O-antigen/teichoic acid export membrane protein